VWIVAAGQKVRVTRKVARAIEQSGGDLGAVTCWAATIDSAPDQLLAVRGDGLTLVTDEAVLVLPWSDIAGVEVSEAAGVRRSAIALTNGRTHLVLHYRPADREQFLATVPAELLHDRPAAPDDHGAPGPAPVPATRTTYSPAAAATNAAAALAERATTLTRVLDVLAILVLICGILLTAICAIFYGLLAGPVGFLAANLIGAVATAFNWSVLRLGSVVAQHVAVTNSRALALQRM
jgi:hypothetical protein